MICLREINIALEKCSEFLKLKISEIFVVRDLQRIFPITVCVMTWTIFQGAGAQEVKSRSEMEAEDEKFKHRWEKRQRVNDLKFEVFCVFSEKLSDMRGACLVS